MESLSDSDRNYSIHDINIMINSLPNAPKPEPSGSIRFHQKLFTSHVKPTSFRCMFLYNLRNSNFNLAAHSLQCHYEASAAETSGMQATDTEESVSITPEVMEVSNQRTQRKSVNRKTAKEHVTTMLNEVSPPCVAPNMASGPMTLYSNYVRRLVVGGSIILRISSPHQMTVVMNVIDPETGIFLPDQYVHTTCWLTQTDITFSCECQISRAVQECVAAGDQGQTVAFVDSIQCPHCRFFQEEIMPRKQRIDHMNVSLPGLTQKITSMLQSVIETVVSLPVQKSSSYKFAVLLDTDCSFVSISGQGDNQIIACHSGICRKGRQRLVQTLSEATGLCKHLTIFQEKPELWRDCIQGKQDTALENVCIHIKLLKVF